MEAVMNVGNTRTSAPSVADLWNRVHETEQELVEAAKLLTARRLIQEQCCETCAEEGMEDYQDVLHAVVGASFDFSDALVALQEAASAGIAAMKAASEAQTTK